MLLKKNKTILTKKFWGEVEEGGFYTKKYDNKVTHNTIKISSKTKRYQKTKNDTLNGCKYMYL